MNVIPLHQEFDCHDIAKALRRIAEEIETGEYDFDPTMAVLVTSRESARRETDNTRLSYQWTTHGLGKSDSYFATKGVLACAMASFDGSV